MKDKIENTAVIVLSKLTHEEKVKVMAKIKKWTTESDIELIVPAHLKELIK